MTSEHLIMFFERVPFEPFTMILADGRELHVQHYENALFTKSALAVFYYHPTYQAEIIDAALIVSLRTIGPTDFHSFLAEV